jgi:hypothetical protein
MYLQLLYSSGYRKRRSTKIRSRFRCLRVQQVVACKESCLWSDLRPIKNRFWALQVTALIVAKQYNESDVQQREGWKREVCHCRTELRPAKAPEPRPRECSPCASMNSNDRIHPGGFPYQNCRGGTNMSLNKRTNFRGLIYITITIYHQYEFKKGYLIY